MRRNLHNLQKQLFTGLAIAAVAGCSLEKESGFNRSMQNLTAHYNILFNANEILHQKQEAYAQLPDVYDHLLSVYQDTAAKPALNDKDLEEVKNKAYTIINFKEQSRYRGDAYLLLGKANYLQGNYFNAAEYCSYVTRAFAAQKDLAQQARLWKARALMHIEQVDEARKLTDTAINLIFKKQSHQADVYATRLQYCLNTGRYTEAQAMATKAIALSQDDDHRWRWTFILAQLLDINHQPAQARAAFTRVEQSNALYELSFNAGLNRIRLTDSTAKPGRIGLLLKMLKQDKNKDFIGQIYYHIAEAYFDNGNLAQATTYYQLSARHSAQDANQKGLAYYRLADISFKYKADYTTAKRYFDSTLYYLPRTNPAYPAIAKKSGNLQLLSAQLLIIAREDSLQAIARLPLAQRDAKIAAMAKSPLFAPSNSTPAGFNAAGKQAIAPVGTSQANSTFYFYNKAAITQGQADFKRIWGTRPNTDFWRIGSKQQQVQNAANAMANAGNTGAANNAAANNSGNPAASGAGTNPVNQVEQNIKSRVPLTPVLLAQSNTRQYNAYVELANIYRDVLGDKKEAIATYLLILSRFDSQASKPLIYYNLYRLYSDGDIKLADDFKNRLLKNYPESTYARLINDPAYYQKINDKNARFNALYTALYEQVANRRYQNAADTAQMLIDLYGTSNLIAQVYYLKAIALGHNQKLEPFKANLDDIAARFADDKLIAPLAKEHLKYIASNEAELAARPVVLVDADPKNLPFMEEPIAEKITAKNYTEANLMHLTAKQATEQAKLAEQQGTKTYLIQTRPLVDTTTKAKPAHPVAEAPSIFTLNPKAAHYVAICVNVPANVAPSRFGIGQFNRARYQAGSISHQLKVIGSSQLIYIGVFNGLTDAKAYARALAPMLPSIMKVQAADYNFFIISQENLDKLADKKTIDAYYDFYQRKILAGN